MDSADRADGTYRLVSASVADTFKISIAECGGDPRTTLIVVDADGLFGLVVDTIRLMQIPALVPSILVVGIGYPDAPSILHTVTIRTRDPPPADPSRPVRQLHHQQPVIVVGRRADLRHRTGRCRGGRSAAG